MHSAKKGNTKHISSSVSMTREFYKYKLREKLSHGNYVAFFTYALNQPFVIDSRVALDVSSSIIATDE